MDRRRAKEIITIGMTEMDSFVFCGTVDGRFFEYSFTKDEQEAADLHATAARHISISIEESHLDS